jgi:hypothetical protein
LQEDDEAHRQADLKEVAENEADAVPDWHPHRRLLHQGLQPLLVPLTAANQPQAPPDLRAAREAITRHVND